MKREMNELHLHPSMLPMPKSCHDALMDAARSVKEEEPVKHASFRAVWIAAVILVATAAVAIASTQLGWTDYFQKYDITVSPSAQEVMNAAQPISVEVGPLTVTYRQLASDGRIVMSAAEARMTDGSAALIAGDNVEDEAMDAVDDTVLKKYGLESGTTWTEAAAQLHLPLYGVRALLEVSPKHDQGSSMEDTLWNEDGAAVYYNLLYLKDMDSAQSLPVTLYAAVHAYNAETDEVQVNAYTVRCETEIPISPLLEQTTYLSEQPAKLAVSIRDAEQENGGQPTKVKEIALTADRIEARRYATGVYLKVYATVNPSASESDARDALYCLAILDGNGKEQPKGIDLSTSVSLEHWPQAQLETMWSVDRLPETVCLSDGDMDIVFR